MIHTAVTERLAGVGRSLHRTEVEEITSMAMGHGNAL